MRKAGVYGAIVGAIALLALPCLTRAQSDLAPPGQLTVILKGGKAGALCPLKKTRVNANIEGFGARVTVEQEFQNPTDEPIEAVYTFPLPNDAAVDRMTMKIGDRVVEGEIHRREEARAIYESAKRSGQVASLLDQERPNIFTQSVANIMPNASVKIEISYVQVLKYEEGQFEFNFPMVVGPRFLGNAPDPGKIAPPITPKGTRTGAGIELTVNLNAGAPIVDMKSILHDVNIQGQVGQPVARIELKQKDEIPNRDFILRYRTATNTVQSAFITHFDEQKGGFFQLILLPPKAAQPAQIAPREIIFLIDQSGSQQGFPIEKSKELMLKLIGTLRPDDTFNVASFSNQTHFMWQGSKPSTKQNLEEARTYIKNLSGQGGTQMLEALRAVSKAFEKRSERVPIMLFSTDGFVGDDREILDAVRKEMPRVRIFSFGIGNAVNRFLIDGLGVAGRGDSEYVTLQEKADAAVDRLVRRLECPVLTDIQVRVEGGSVDQMLPERIPDVFSEKPIMVCGRYAKPGKARLSISGKLGGEPWAKEISVELGKSAATVVPTLWARRIVDSLSAKTTDSEGERDELKEKITEVALDFGIMSEFTSFVAVEKKVVNIEGKMRTIAVPVEMADGVSYEGIFGLADASMNGLVLGNRPGSFGRAMGGPAAASGLTIYNGTNGVKSTTVYTPTTKSANSKDKKKQKNEKKDPLKVPDAPDRPIPLLKVNGMGITDPTAAALYKQKIYRSLYKVTGTVEIQILVSAVDGPALEKLANLGLKVIGKEDSLKLVFVRCDAKKLVDIAKLDFVRAVSPL